MLLLQNLDYFLVMGNQNFSNILTYETFKTLLLVVFPCTYVFHKEVLSLATVHISQASLETQITKEET